MSDADRDYLLGTHDAEVERLGLQHRVWRSRVLDAWRRAGITVGSRVVDAGAGPGWASLDLAEIVGPEGRVHALERSDRFIHFLQGSAARRGLGNIEAAGLDLVEDELGVRGADAAWIRWVLAFVSDPALVVRKLAGALRPGGVLVIHEYLHYETWSYAPHRPGQQAFMNEVVKGWRASGGEPNVGRVLPELLADAGFRVRTFQPIVDSVSPGDFAWRWATSFLETYSDHLRDAGTVDQAWVDRVLGELAEAEANPASRMILPMVVEVIAEKA
ncbi:MAG: methyltransferase domain-containing protein [Caulobacteraceae bacterium]|nr:methyltransferase domain-containing protein [Caulobacteraceae bacterium]